MPGCWLSRASAIVATSAGSDARSKPSADLPRLSAGSRKSVGQNWSRRPLRPDLDAVAVEVEAAQQRPQPRPGDALREADPFEPGITLVELQAVDEAAELAAVDLVVGGEQHGSGADHFEVGVEAGLNLASRLLGVGDELGARARFGGDRRGRRHVPARRNREAVCQDEQYIRDRSAQKQLAQRVRSTVFGRHRTKRRYSVRPVRGLSSRNGLGDGHSES